MISVDELLPVSIAVPAHGLEQAAVFRALGLTSSQVYPLMGDVIGSPRHYRYPSRPHYSTFYFTPDGVRALAEHFGIRVEVKDPAAATAPKPPMWWQKDDA